MVLRGEGGIFSFSETIASSISWLSSDIFGSGVGEIGFNWLFVQNEFALIEVEIFRLEANTFCLLAGDEFLIDIGDLFCFRETIFV